jgi:type IV pilus assembly protein PilQ
MFKKCMKQFMACRVSCIASGCFVFFSGIGMAQDATSRYTGKPLTLNFQTIEVRAALQIIADFTGLNVVASDSVTGSLSLRLHQVPWDQVLDIIAQTKGLSQSKQGNVIWVATRAEIAARDKQEIEMRQALQNLEPLITHNFVLNYAKAADVAQHIQGFGGLAGSSQALHGLGGQPSEMDNNAILYFSNKHPFGQYHSPARPYDAPSMGATHANASQSVHNLSVGSANLRGTHGRLLSARGSVMAEPRTNQLFVTDIASRVDAIQQIIAKIDIPLRQVMIEARIVQASDTFGQTLGVRLGGVSDGAHSKMADKALNPTGLFVNLPAGNINGFEPASFAVSLFNAEKNKMLNLELSALEADGKGKVVSSPRVVTADQAKAIIEQGTELPYQMAAASGATAIAFRKANLKLEVTPQITPEGNIVLELDIHKDSVGQNTAAGFAIDTKHVNTQVLVDNGGTVMIGGIFESIELDEHQKVPLLADIPLLGYLFKSRRTNQSKQELLVFITPKMVSQSASAQ